jgi:hypothetical protein
MVSAFRWNEARLEWTDDRLFVKADAFTGRNKFEKWPAIYPAENRLACNGAKFGTTGGCPQPFVGFTPGHKAALKRHEKVQCHTRA